MNVSSDYPSRGFLARVASDQLRAMHDCYREGCDGWKPTSATLDRFNELSMELLSLVANSELHKVDKKLQNAYRKAYSDVDFQDFMLRLILPLDDQP